MKRSVFAPLVIILLLLTEGLSSCQSKTISSKNTTSQVAKVEIPQHTLDSLAGLVGNYSCKCQTGDKQILLTIKKSNSGFNTTISYTPTGFKTSGIIKPDTTNFDPDFQVWSFTDRKDIYGFRFAETSDNKWHVVMINEDYKKVFKECSDAKVIVFENLK